MLDNTDRVIDSREVIDRIQELQDEWEEATEADADEFVLSEDDWAAGLGVDGAHEIVSLMALAEQADNTPDWEHGETLIHDDHFTDYTRELLTDVGIIPGDLPDWVVVDWDETADNIRVDYFDVDFDGETYWVRN